MSVPTSTSPSALLRCAAEGLAAGTHAPYLGPGLLALCDGPAPPSTPVALAAALAARVSVPGKLRNRLSAAAQFIENFKHRQTLRKAMNEIFAVAAAPSALHRWIAGLRAPLVVDAWYDDCVRAALVESGGDFAEVQGVSRAEHRDAWIAWYGADATPLAEAPSPRTVLYRPWGGHAPAGNYVVSDSDFVEVLTEIDIQTPIPEAVQRRRATLGFVFLGCRFDDQLPRAYARQILKRSAGPHFAVLPDEPTRMETRFLAEMGIARIDLPIAAVAAAWSGPAASA